MLFEKSDGVIEAGWRDHLPPRTIGIQINDGNCVAYHPCAELSRLLMQTETCAEFLKIAKKLRAE